MKIEAANPKDAYEKFIEKVGRYPEELIVESGWLVDNEIFDDHIEEAKAPKRKAEEAKRKADNDRVTQTGPELSLVWTG